MSGVDEISALNFLFREYWNFVLESWPTLATFIGNHQHDHRLEDLSQEAFDKWTSKASEFLYRLRGVSQKPLTTRDKVNYDLFERELRQRVDAARFRPNLIALSQLEGPHISLLLLSSISRFATASDYDNYLKRLQSFPVQIDQTISNLEEGLRVRIVLARATAERVMQQINSQIVSIPEACDLYAPAKRFPASFSQEEKNGISRRLNYAIIENVVSSYRKLRDFMQGRYLSACRSEIGICSLPNGKAWYRFCIRSYTTTELSPEQVHDLGRAELARTKNEMKNIVNKIGFNGDLQAFFNHLRTDSALHNTSAESILQRYQEILNCVEVRARRFFHRFPRARLELREIEASRAKEAPTAHYVPQPDDGARPAYLYVNTYKPETRPRYDMEALAYHEGIPGHHYQLSLQRELKGLPDFRRHGGYMWPGYSAFIEGWALYSELLPKELGLYSNPYAEFGRLLNDALRAARLVVDTGVNYFKWTREEAMSFLETTTALSTVDIAAEVERYVAVPGQALAYKIGQLKILELRAKAEKTLGALFDIRDFHEKILEEGALPFDIVEKKLESWLSQKVSTFQA